MSFSYELKSELVRQKLKSQKQRVAQLCGLALCCGSIRLSRSPKLCFNTEHPEVSGLIAKLFEQLYEVDVVVELKEREHRKTPLIQVTLSGVGVENFLRDSGILTQDPDGIRLSQLPSPELMSTPEAEKAFLRGSFLGSGTCVSPLRSYHVELVCRNAQTAEFIASLLCNYTLDAKLVMRKSRYVVYLNDGDNVMGFMALLGANMGALRFEDVRAEKETRNYVNRASNCESANIGRAVSASVRQQQAIELILANINPASLPEPIVEAMRLRMDNPLATLGELAELAGIQKSGMNHRLARILKLAEQIEGNNGTV